MRSGNRILSALALLAALILAAPACAQTAAQPVAPAAAPERKETIEADISTRTISIGTSFTGTRVVIFGTVENSRQTKPDEGLYDVAVVIAGPKQGMVVRRKANVGGIWINTSSVRFKDVPSYYKVLTTRPLDRVAPKPVLYQQGIGFQNMRFATIDKVGVKELEDFRDSIVRIKMDQRLFQEEERGVEFIGRSLFRATVDLPANVSIGDFTAFIFLFREGELLSSFKTQLGLEREGLERAVHDFAIDQPFLYGCASVLVALLAGLIATFVLRKD
jgi:uncharacterized protein (TIGR02186 family)